LGSLLIIQHEKDYSEQKNEIHVWGSSSLPLFLDYDLIIAEFPSRDVLTEDLLFEYQQARQAGCHFIWLINDAADKAFMSSVLQTRVIGLGRSGMNISFVSEFSDFEAIVTGFNFSFEDNSRDTDFRWH